jgi:hypothetical protein
VKEIGTPVHLVHILNLTFVNESQL